MSPLAVLVSPLVRLPEYWIWGALGGQLGKWLARRRHQPGAIQARSMTVKRWIVTALLRLYPTAWRSEYGPELEGMLLARPLGPCVVADVLWNGLWQRARIAEPSTIMGLASILVILAGFVWSGIYDRSSHWKVLPVVGLTFLASWVFALLSLHLLGAGLSFDTAANRPGPDSRR